MIRRLLLGLMLACGAASAEQKQESGEYVVHYSAQNTTELSPEIAARYGVSRNPQLAMVMITAQKKTGEPITAAVNGQTRNLLGQTQLLEMREIREATSIYYLGLFTISNRETLTFNFDIRPKGSPQLLELRFSQQFFVD
jgi:hypothetical protein